MTRNTLPSAAHWRILLTLAVAVFLSLHLWQVFPLPPLTALENFSYDLRLENSFKEGVDSRVVVVAIDDQSVGEIGNWPWSRNHLAKLVTTLFGHYRIAALAMDVVFSEPDRSSGLRVLESLAEGGLKNGVDSQKHLDRVRSSLANDHLLAQGMFGKPVALGFHFDHDGIRPPDPRHKLPKPIIDLWEIGRTRVSTPVATNFVGNLDILQQAAMAGGFVSNLLVDADGVTRRMPLFYRYQDNLYASLPLAAVQVLLGNPAITVGSPDINGQPGQLLRPQWIAVDDYRIPVDENGAVLVPFRGRQGSFRYISATDIVNKTLSSAALTGTVAILGITATGVGHGMDVPFQKNFASVETQANIVSGILEGRIKERSRQFLWLDTAIMLSCIALLALVGGYSPLWNPLFTVLLTSLLVMINWLAWERGNLVLSLGIPVLAILAIFGINALLPDRVSRNKHEEAGKDSSPHQEVDSFWEEPPEAWRLDTNKMVVKESPSQQDEGLPQ